MNVTGMEQIKENTFAVLNEEAYIEISFPYQKIENVHIDIQPEKRNGKYNKDVYKRQTWMSGYIGT